MDCAIGSASSNEKDDLIEGCRTGRTLIAAATLIEMTENKRNEVLTTQTTDDNGQSYSPFLIAVRNGHLKLSRLLLTMFAVDPNAKCHVGNIFFDGYLVEGTTPLWCAAAIGNFELVELLHEQGANINDCTASNSSPLRAACFTGNLRIVQFLIENSADLTIANRYQNTCLMVASYRGHIEIVEHLLESGSDPNVKASCGSTALHFCADGSQLDIAKLLVEKGCDVNIKNNNGLTAPMSAADACYMDMVIYFVNLPSMTLDTKIMLLELLGASFANDKDHYDTEKTYQFLYLAMLMRDEDNRPKEISTTPTPAYFNRLETRTLQELEAIRSDIEALHMESLIVRERILGSTSMELLHPILYRGAVYADRLQFGRSISLWQHALNLKQQNEQSAHADLYRFAEVFSQMVVLREEVDVDALACILKCTLLELNRTRESMEKSKASLESGIPLLGEVVTKDKVDSLQSQLEGNMHVMLYLLLVVTKSARTNSEEYKCGKVIYQFVKSDFRDRNGRTPLHLTLDEATPVDDFHVKDVCSFPDSEIARLLLSCGADPNAICNKGNTPLHTIVQYAKPISDFMTLHNAITDLLRAGAHADARNAKGQAPLDITTTGVAEIILKKESEWTLSCFAARAVRKYNIPYLGHVPKTLEEFIEMH